MNVTILMLVVILLLIIFDEAVHSDLAMHLYQQFELAATHTLGENSLAFLCGVTQRNWHNFDCLC